MVRVFPRITWVLFILALPVLLIAVTISAAVNCLWLYEYGFAKNEVGKSTGLAAPQLDRVARGLIGYFNSKDEFIDLTVEKDGKPFKLFNEREIAHLKDVKGLFRLAYWCVFGALVYTLVFLAASFFWWHDRRLPASGLFLGACLALGLMVVLGIIAATNFEGFFRGFHLISFANDLWMLDPSRDYLIMLFPQEFWFDAAIFCFATVALLAVVLGTLGYWRMKEFARSGAPRSLPPSV